MSTKRSSNAKWLHATTGDYCNLITKGTTPRSGFNSSIESSIPFLRVQNLRFDGRLNINSENLNFVSLATHDGELSRSKVYPGDILINLVGPPLGKVSLVSEEYQEWNINQAVAIFRPQQTLNSEFLKNYLQLPQVRTWLENQSKKTSGQQNLTLETCRDLPLLLPPLPEQRKIAEILSTWDEALEKLDALIEAKERSKKALMQQLLSRAAARSGRTHTRHRLGEIVERVTRKNTILNDRVLTISAQGGLVDQREYFSRNVAGADLSGYYLLKKGEFAYNRSSSKGYPFGALKRLDQYDTGVVSTLYLCFRIKSDAPASSEYLCHYFEGGRLNFGLRSIAKEGARAHGLLNVTADEFFDLDIFLPSVGDQQKIAAILDTADQELSLLRNQRTALDQQKQGLMQRLLTGIIRVK
jgi:type I restriction enzyme, S subunit